MLQYLWVVVLEAPIAPTLVLPASVLFASVLVHIVFSPVLIFGLGPIPALGVAGAGWGLVLSFGVGSLVLFAWLRSRHSLVVLSFRSFRPDWKLFGEFFRVGVPGILNVAITNLTVIALTGVAGHLGREAAIGYGLGARLEYIVIPLAFGFGTAIVAMVGTNWGAKQHQRARSVAWAGGLIVASACGAIGLFFAFSPELWLRLYSDDLTVVRIGTSYLRIVGPAYVLYGFGMALYFACQGLGKVVLAVSANGIRLLMAVAGGYVAIDAIGTGPSGVFVAIAVAFLAYAVLTSVAFLRISAPRHKDDDATRMNP